MKTRKLGRTELEVPVIAFGAWAAGGWMWGGTDDAAAVAAIRRGIELGMDAVDTAPIYGFGHSERVVGAAIAGRRDEVVVMTKAGLRWDDDRGELFFEYTDDHGRARKVFRNSRPDSIRHEAMQSLARLGVDHLDLLQVHWPDATTPIADTMGVLAELRDEGKVREVGVSNYSPDQLAEAQRALGDVPLASTQPCYSLVFRNIEVDVLPAARELGLGTLVYSPLAQGLLTGTVDPDRVFPEGDQRRGKEEFSPEGRRLVNEALGRAVRPVAERHGATLAQVALAWTVAQPGVTSALAGARTARQVAENAGAGDLELTADELRAIGEAFPRR
jgi:aryl-alcohol dehydrogenase-like predicted oxidoreductase